MVLHYVVFALIGLMALKFEYVISFDFYLDIYKKTGKIKINLFFVKVFDATVKFEGLDDNGHSFVIYIGKKRREVSFETQKNKGKKDKYVISLQGIKNIMSYVLISELGIHAKIGDKDALRATMLMGSTKIIYCAIISFLKSRQNVKISETFVPFYNEDVFILDFYGILNISFADIIFSLFLNLADKIRHAKYRRRES